MSVVARSLDAWPNAQLLAKVTARRAVPPTAPRVGNIIEETAKQGLLSKLHVGRSYDEVANLLEPEHYQACHSAQVADRAAPYVPNEVEELAAPTGAGPGYDADEALEAVASRYERISDLYALTLARVLRDDRTRGLFDGLRADGWLDWHLLGAVASITMNYRANELGLYNGPNINQGAMRDLMYAKEDESSIVVPLEAYNPLALKMALETNAMTVAAGLGLTPPTQTPNFDANLDLLRARYGYGTDDVPHLDLLGPASSTRAATFARCSSSSRHQPPGPTLVPVAKV